MRCPKKESEVTTKPKPGNQPDPADVPGTLENDGGGNNPATSDPELAEEEEAARLGDFA